MSALSFAQTLVSGSAFAKSMRSQMLSAKYSIDSIGANLGPRNWHVRPAMQMGSGSAPISSARQKYS